MVATIGTNSYVDVSEADLYFADRLYSDAWTTFPDKDAALISATMVIDSLCIWHGDKTDSAQLLEFPRDLTDDVVPEKIKIAQMEIALEAINQGTISVTEPAQKLKSLKADVVAFSFFESMVATLTIINSLAKAMVRPYGNCIYGGGSIQNVPLVR